MRRTMARVAHLVSGSHFFFEMSCAEALGGVDADFVLAISKEDEQRLWVNVVDRTTVP
jgi:hypothetical protein